MGKVISFTPKPGSPNHWVSGNPDMFFVATESRARKCFICQKMIRPGERYFGAYKVKLRWSKDGGELREIHYTDKVEMRVHKRCAEK